MPDLNLLPPEKIKHLQHIYLFLFLRIMIELLIVFTIVLSIFLIGARLMLEDSINELTAKSSKINENYKSFNRLINGVNRELKNILVVRQEEKNWPEIFYTVLTALPADIKLTSIAIIKSGEITLTGKALTRDAFTKMKTALENLPLLTNLQAPLANLAAEKNIDFRFTANLKP